MPQIVFDENLVFRLYNGVWIYYNRYYVQYHEKRVDDWQWLWCVSFRGRDRKVCVWMREWLCKRIPDGRRTTRVRKRTRKIIESIRQVINQRRTVCNKTKVKSKVLARNFLCAQTFSTRKKSCIIYTEKEKKKKFARRFLGNIWIPIFIRSFLIIFLFVCSISATIPWITTSESYSTSAHQTSPPPETTNDLNIRKRNIRLFLK